MALSAIVGAVSDPWLWTFVAGSILLLATSPAPGFLRRGRPRVAFVRQGSPERVLVLVHGTFAQSAAWTTTQSNLLRNLDQVNLRGFTCHRLLWSGCNFQWDREKAVRCLCSWLEGLDRNIEVCLIGHSHGGNIAALAASRLHNRLIKVVTLSTPYVAVSLRSMTFLPIRRGAQEVRDQRFLITAVSFMTALLVFAPLLVATRDFRWLGGAVMAALALNLTLLHYLPALSEARNTVMSSLTINLESERLLILRATADEASGLLGTSSVIVSILNLALRLLGVVASVARAAEDAVLRHRALAGLLVFVFTVLTVVLLGDTRTLEQNVPSLAKFLVANISGIFWTWAAMAILGIGAISGLFAPVLAVVGALASMICAIFFGLDMALVATFATVSAEATPIGSHFVSNRPGGSWGIAHSYLYDAVGTAYDIQRFLDEA